MTVISQVKSRTGSCFKTEAVTGSYPKFKIQPTPWSYAALMAVFALGKSPGSNAICLGRVGQVCLETEEWARIARRSAPWRRKVARNPWG